MLGRDTWTWVGWSFFMWFGAIVSWEYLKPNNWYMISCDRNEMPYEVVSEFSLRD